MGRRRLASALPPGTDGRFGLDRRRGCQLAGDPGRRLGLPSPSAAKLVARFPSPRPAPRQPRLPRRPRDRERMRLLVFRSLWSNGFDLDAALADRRTGAFDGVEGPVPAEPSARRQFADKVAAAGAPFIAEIATGGGYVPRDRSPERQLEEF